MGMGWKSVEPVPLFTGERYEMDGSRFEIISGVWENKDRTQEWRIGIRWKKANGINYPPGEGLALPSKPEEIDALISVLRNQIV